MAMTPLRETLESLQTAEEFLDHFAIAYDQHVVDVCRLHILKRAHDYLQDRGVQSLDDAALHGAFARVLQRAYDDFVVSDPLTERVFKVLQDAPRRPRQPAQTFIALGDVLGVTPESRR
jgi:nitrogenase-stabilizing/protective protein